MEAKPVNLLLNGGEAFSKRVKDVMPNNTIRFSPAAWTSESDIEHGKKRDTRSSSRFCVGATIDSHSDVALH